MSLFRRERPAAPKTCVIEPSIVVVVQGAKKMWLGGEGFSYDTTRFLITSLELPADSEVIHASKSTPCLGMVLKLNLEMMTELMMQSELAHHHSKSSGMSAGIGSATPSILDPFLRLIQLIDEPRAIPIIAPLIQREIHYRLLLSDQSAKLHQITSVDSKGYRISQAIEWIKSNLSTPLRIEALASRVQMSTPSFHQHFRQLTAMSPLQYQKWMRLSEAKRLMLNDHLSASSAAFKVGYESPSQFSREYSRLFGTSPKKDILLLRGSANQAER
nr:AraC family transcriptional regulator [Rosenbergiella epipactidis]